MASSRSREALPALGCGWDFPPWSGSAQHQPPSARLTRLISGEVAQSWADSERPASAQQAGSVPLCFVTLPRCAHGCCLLPVSCAEEREAPSLLEQLRLCSSKGPEGEVASWDGQKPLGSGSASWPRMAAAQPLLFGHAAQFKHARPFHHFTQHISNLRFPRRGPSWVFNQEDTRNGLRPA